MNNYKLIIQYDGTQYAGWQIQNNADTVQKRIVDAVKIITGENVNLIGSGRTDAGVHAFGQVANFKTENDIDLYKFKHSLNAILPNDIAVTISEKTAEEFHARFDARKRSYLYFFSKSKSPFVQKYSHYYHGELNCATLNRLSINFIGQKDFSSFAKKNTETVNKVCTVYSAYWKETRGLVIFNIEADRFLHGMVRTIVGTLLQTVKLGYDFNYLHEIFEAKNRDDAGEAVPAKGLFLYKVKY